MANLPGAETGTMCATGGISRILHVAPALKEGCELWEEGNGYDGLSDNSSCGEEMGLGKGLLLGTLRKVQVGRERDTLHRPFLRRISQGVGCEEQFRFPSTRGGSSFPILLWTDVYLVHAQIFRKSYGNCFLDIY